MIYPAGGTAAAAAAAAAVAIAEAVAAVAIAEAAAAVAATVERYAYKISCMHIRVLVRVSTHQYVTH
jgi:hypothetical protein